MLHSKYFEILKQFLGDYKSEIYGRALIDRVKLSQKGIALSLEELEKQRVLKSRKEGNLKHYGLNLKYTEIKDLLAITELIRKLEFLNKEREIAHCLKKDNRIVGIFGSYARGTNKKNSDLDVFIIGGKKREELKFFNLNASFKYFSQNEWRKLLKKKNNLCREILEKHILLFGIENFINLAWSDYYGFS